ncbi:pentatricopeptide repeat-containing protein [Pyrus ussuriensis x Pyrus communis]|uniref:Pentatricopeptide repeat-containing protein n=1 Tax=Pyrus ussuriensis x Pyrus communis TaxID=2448454 RepID=A0A5N5GD72_9ROSA|nr:pentatricopeptide repeat-containing protein [Pyrus ussuriensis x Pyrus communis]
MGEEVAWHRPRFGLPRLGCLLRMRKLLEFDFLAAVDRAIKDKAAKIGAAKDEMFDERTVECEVAFSP